MNKMFKIIMICCCFLLFSVAFVFSNGQKENNGDSFVVEIAFWKAPHSEYEAEYWKPIIDAFEILNPDIKVNHLVTPWETWTEKYTAAFAGGNPPDVSYMTEWYPNFAKAGQLLDLSSKISPEIKDRYARGAWEYATYDGSVIGIPYIGISSVVFYNKALFRENGIEIPKTMAELRAAAVKLTKDTDGDGETDQWGMAFEFSPINMHQIIPSVIQAGTSYLNEDATELGFANQEGVAGLKSMTDLIIKDKVAPPIDMFNDEQYRQAFLDGKVAMVIDQIWWSAAFRKDAPDLELGAFLMPAGSADDPVAARATYGGVGLFSISEASKKKDAAWRFIQYITSPEVEIQYLEKANFLSPNMDSNAGMYIGDEIMEVGSEAQAYAFNYPMHDKWKEMDTIIKNMIEEIVREVKDVETAVYDANIKAKRVLSK